mmetsp:Transcript_16940/g.44477  ORF Transcript_16940/g.44477 Transcript_16940/m.44477 type:complete len:213 (+) Transcript_16940:489-1127(+)
MRRRVVARRRQKVRQGSKAGSRARIQPTKTRREGDYNEDKGRGAGLPRKPRVTSRCSILLPLGLPRPVEPAPVGSFTLRDPRAVLDAAAPGLVLSRGARDRRTHANMWSTRHPDHCRDRSATTTRRPRTSRVKSGRARRSVLEEPRVAHGASGPLLRGLRARVTQTPTAKCTFAHQLRPTMDVHTIRAAVRGVSDGYYDHQPGDDDVWVVAL